MAVTHDLFYPSHDNPNGVPAQQDEFEGVGETTKIVTLTIGGNDALFEQVLDACTEGLRGTDWEAIEKTLQKGWGCSRDKEWTAGIRERISYLGGAEQDSVIVGPKIHPISEVLQMIHAKAPHATVYIAGYPQFFGTKLDAIGVEKKRTFMGCIVGQVPGGFLYSIRSDDASWINKQAAYLNQVIRDAVKNDKYDIPAKYVSPGLFAGHGLCDIGQPWLNGLITVDPTDERERMVDKASFHPTAKGQEFGYGEAFKQRLARNP